MSESVPSQSTDRPTDSANGITRTYGRTHEDLGGDMGERVSVGNARERAHCKHGHSLAGENLRVTTYGGVTRRECATCRRDRDRDRWREKKTAGKSPVDDRLPFRIHQRIERDDAGCWFWTGALNQYGYGRTTRGSAKERISAHRFVYELLVGPIPEGFEIDHLCRVRHCVNPEHLEAVTHKVNVLRGTAPTAVNASKTHCLNGHPFANDNLKLVTRGRACRKCTQDLRAARREREGNEGKKLDAERARAYRARKRAEREAAA